MAIGKTWMKAVMLLILIRQYTGREAISVYNSVFQTEAMGMLTAEMLILVDECMIN